VSASVLEIEELTGKKRKISLRGAGLPFQGATWTGETNVVTQWNAGNPEATQHVLSPQELPSSWEGEWNTTRLLAAPSSFAEKNGADNDVVFAYSLVDIFESIRRGGQRLRVTWSTNVQTQFFGDEPGAVRSRSFKVTRVGRLTSFAFSPDRLDDISWSMTFDWLGRGEPQRKTLRRKEEDVLSASRRAQAAQNELVAQIELASIRGQNRRKNEVSAFRLGDLEALADGPRQLVDDFARSVNSITNRMKNLGDLVLKVRDTPAAIAGQAVDVATNAVSVANQFVDAISRDGPEAWSTRNKVSNLTRAADYYGKSQTQAELMSSVAEEMARAARRRRSANVPQRNRYASTATTNDVLAVHVPREGETLLSISMRYYEADLSAELAVANGLPAYTIEPPMRVPLVIPTRSVLESRETESV
jgi:hypothetical protein